MKFFNPKEDVLDIKLTQHGKSLLAEGRLKPAYYAFFDHDILYDGTYAGISEHQNSVVPRIRDKTPKLHTQAHFDTLDEADYGFSVEYDAATRGYIIVPSSLNRAEYLELKALGMPMGTSEYGNINAPSWNIEYLYGELNESVNYYSGSIQKSSIPVGTAGTLDGEILSGSLMYWQIPQLKSTIEWETFVTYVDSDTQELVKDYIPEELADIVENITGLPSAENMLTPRAPDTELPLGETTDPIDAELGQPGVAASFIDGSVIQVKPDYLLLEVGENNVEFLKENFDVEVIQLVKVGQNNGQYHDVEKKLYFYDPEIDSEIGPEHVEYWFDVSVDEEILDEYFCASSVVANKKKQLRYEQTKIYPDCPDYDGTRDLYKKDLEDHGEPC